jgi:hypothetical protein
VLTTARPGWDAAVARSLAWQEATRYESGLAVAGLILPLAICAVTAAFAGHKRAVASGMLVCLTNGS